MPFSISIVSCCFAFNSFKSFRPIRSLGQWEASFDGPIRKRSWIIGQIFAIFIGYQVQTCNCCYPTHYSTHYLKSWNRFLLVNKSSNQNHKLIYVKTKGYFSNSFKYRGLILDDFQIQNLIELSLLRRGFKLMLIGKPIKCRHRKSNQSFNLKPRLSFQQY